MKMRLLTLLLALSIVAPISVCAEEVPTAAEPSGEDLYVDEAITETIDIGGGTVSPLPVENPTTTTVKITLESVTAGSDKVTVVFEINLEDSATVETSGNETTFTLPVPSTITGNEVKAYQNGILLGTYAIQENNQTGERYVKITTTSNITAKQYAEQINLNASEVSLYTGEKYKLTAEVLPDNTTDKTITWTTSSGNILTVENGEITAKSAGTATVTAAAADNSGITAVCTITVQECNAVTEGDNTVAVNTGEFTKVAFTADYDDEYIFSTTGSLNADGYLYDEYGAQLKSGKADEANGSFSMRYSLKAGSKVFIGINCVASGESGNITLKVVRVSTMPTADPSEHIHQIDSNKICSICNRVFTTEGMKVMTLPLSMKTVDAEAFKGIAAEAVVLPDVCETIDSSAFSECPNLKYIFITKTVESIAEDAFEGSSVELICVN